MSSLLFQIRVTGILAENDRILLVKQRISSTRDWSLPGGRAEAGELLEEALVREFREETGLIVKMKRLLYICDKPDCDPPVIHVTFLLERTGGQITLPTNEYDANPIGDVRMAPIAKLEAYGFSRRFRELAAGGFQGAGNYMGLKENIGL
jgi:ADP-ribose pyrophosphatase YjhB (NUDIX family)